MKPYEEAIVTLCHFGLSFDESKQFLHLLQKIKLPDDFTKVVNTNVVNKLTDVTPGFDEALVVAVQMYQ